MSEPRRIEVLFTSECKRSLRRLSERYRSIRKDLGPVLEKLGSGETFGNRVRGTSHVVYKVRVPTSDANRGKSGGYRALYYIETADRVILVTIFARSDQGDISSAELARILDGVT